MFARCPACQTVFRVRPEQLRAHHGDVRCGRCYAAFNALEHLFERAPDSAAPTAAPPRTPPSPRATPSATEPDRPTVSEAPSGPAESELPVSADTDGFFILEEREAIGGTQDELPLDDVDVPGAQPSADSEVVDFSGDLDFEIPDRFGGRSATPPAPAAGRREPTVAGTDAFPEFLDLSDLNPPPAAEGGEQEPETGRAAPPAPPSFDPWSLPGRREPGLAVDALAASASTEPREAVEPRPFAATVGPEGASPPPAPARAIELPRIDRPTIAAGAEFFETPAAPSVRRDDDDASAIAQLDATYGPAPGSPRRRWLLGLGVGLLAGALLVQGAYVFREEIARRWPPLRPLFVSICARLHCELPLPRIAGAISVEASDLQSEPGRTGRYVLNATIRNRAPHPQAYPHLELTLTDAQDRPVVRRVLNPAEWVPAAALQQGGLERGFEPGRDLVVRLPFEATGLAASGYRVYVFYP